MWRALKRQAVGRSSQSEVIRHAVARQSVGWESSEGSLSLMDSSDINVKGGTNGEPQGGNGGSRDSQAGYRRKWEQESMTSKSAAWRRMRSWRRGTEADY